MKVNIPKVFWKVQYKKKKLKLSFNKNELKFYQYAVFVMCSVQPGKG